MNRRDALKRTTILMGAGLSASTIIGIMSGCQPNNALADLDWQPSFFDENQAQMIVEIAERIIPRTDTPGAKDVGVPQFIDTIFARYFQTQEQKKIIAGLNDISQRAEKAYNKSFLLF